MARNMYDRPDFFAGYSRIPMQVHGLDGAPEWPIVRAMMPDLRGAHVLDLGCGFGWFARWARESGAASVLAHHHSEKMIARAKVMTRNDAVAYQIADLESVDLAEAAFGLAYSSLAFHYLEDFGRLVRAVHAALRPEWPVSDYAREGRRTTDWLSKGVVKHHRKVATTLNGLISAGFTLRELAEFAPTRSRLPRLPICPRRWSGR